MVRANDFDLRLCCSIVPLLLRIREFAPHARKINAFSLSFQLNGMLNIYFPFVALGDFYLKELKLMAKYHKYSRVSLLVKHF